MALIFRLVLAGLGGLSVIASVIFARQVFRSVFDANKTKPFVKDEDFYGALVAEMVMGLAAVAFLYLAFWLD